MSLSKRNTTILFVLIIVFASAVRFFHIDQNPPSLNWDEISHGYNAYSILKTGADEWGQKFPIIFRAYGDYKLPVYIYLTAISEAIFGLNTFSVRLVSVVAGILSVLFTYLIAKELFGKKVGIWASLLMAISPWSLFLSRGAFEANLALFFVISGMYFFVRGLKKHWYMVLATVLLGLSVWTYNSARVFVPTIIFASILIYFSDIKKIVKKSPKNIYLALVCLFLFLFPMFYQLINPVGQARYSKVSILDEGAVNEIIEQRITSELPNGLERLIYNKATYFGGEFVKNYISHFSPRFLFVKGGDQYQFSVPARGVLYWTVVPFMIIGLLVVVKNSLKRKKSFMLILSWLVLAPVASSVTREAPHVLRSIVMLPIPMIISALGIVYCTQKIRNQSNSLLFSAALILVFSLCTVGYLAGYFGEYREKYSWSWQYGYKQVVDYAKQHYDEYDKIIVTKKYGEPHEFFLYYLKYDPLKYNDDPNLIRFAQSEWFWVDRFDKYYFVNDWQINENGTGPYKFNLESGREVDCTNSRCLLIAADENVANKWRMLKQINFLNDEPAFMIYEN